jgi:ribosomal protein S18 acetylase RimI-like enzyme
MEVEIKKRGWEKGIREDPEETSTVRIVNFEEKYRNSLVKLYIEIWKEPPWNEFFWTPELVNEDINFGLSQKDFVGILAINPNEEVIGFTWGYKLPLEKFPFLKNVVEEKTFYIDELGVRADYRKRKIGTLLTNKLTEEVVKLGYETLVLRTDVNSGAYIFYKKLGFEDLNIRDPQYPERTYMKKSLR